MLKTFRIDGLLFRHNYYIHCSHREGSFMFCAIHEELYSFNTEEVFYYTSNLENLETALDEYLKFLTNKVLKYKIKQFYFQGKLVLTVSATV